MPREPFKSLSAQEQKLIFHFLREGGVEERIGIVEKKARIPRGDGMKMLRRKHVAMEIERRKAQVELEQAKVIARDQNRAAEEEDKRQSVTLDKIEGKLYRLLDLDPEKHGPLVLSAIQTGLVYTGTIRNGRMERMVPVNPSPDGKDPESGPNFYDSVFDRMRAEQAEVEPAPLLPEAAPAPLTGAHPPATHFPQTHIPAGKAAPPPAAKPAPAKPNPAAPGNGGVILT